MLFDTHAHYDSRQFDADRDQVLSGLPGQGVSLVVNPGCDLPSSRKAVELARQYPFVYAAVGVHPEDCADWEDGRLLELRTLAAEPKVRAIGEIGLDYYWKENPPRDLQQRVFRHQMELAGELGLPVIVHDRDAHGDCMAIVREYPQVTGVFHCFSGSAEMARELIGLGWMISFTGVLTYRNARKAVEAAQEQLESIRKLQRAGLLDQLPDKLQLTAALRLENPELTLSELAEEFDPPVTKSCLNHRLRKITQLAKGL